MAVDNNENDLLEGRKVVYFRIPKSVDQHRMRAFALKYRELRLKGLELSPEAFSSKLAVEEQFPEEEWISRVNDPRVETFIGALAPANSSRDKEDVTESESEWVAQVSVRGPMSHKDFSFPPDSGQPQYSTKDFETHEFWHYFSLYMLPMYRGKGISKRLCQETIKYLRDVRPKSLVLRGMGKRANTPSLSLFKSLGFVDVGSCTMAEGVAANLSPIPDDLHDSKYHMRVGFITLLPIEKE